MKKIWILTGLLFIISSCYSQNNNSDSLIKCNTNTMKNTNITRPFISDEFEILDIKKYKELGTLTKVQMGGENEGKSYMSLNYKQYENGVTYRLGGDDIAGYYSSEISDSSFIVLNKSYYPNGKISQKSLTLDCNTYTFLIGRVYRYDTDGYLNYSVDQDNGYQFLVEDVMTYLLQVEKLPLKRGFLLNGSFFIELYRHSENKKPLWKVNWRVFGDEMDTMIYLTLDGTTGEVVSRIEKKVPFMPE